MVQYMPEDQKPAHRDATEAECEEKKVAYQTWIGLTEANAQNVGLWQEVGEIDRGFVTDSDEEADFGGAVPSSAE